MQRPLLWGPTSPSNHVVSRSEAACACSDLSNNQLRGRIRWNWAALNSVDYIDVSGNNLSGGLPESWYAEDGLAGISTLCVPPPLALFVPVNGERFCRRIRPQG